MVTNVGPKYVNKVAAYGRGKALQARQVAGTQPSITASPQASSGPMASHLKDSH